MRTFNQNNAVRVVGTPGSWAAAAVDGLWHNMTGYQRATFIPMNGELDANMAVAIYAASDAEGTGAEALTGKSGTFTNGTDEGRAGIIEVLQSDLPAGKPYVTARCTPGAADAYACALILSENYEAPVSNGTANGIAFAAGQQA
jgi:hypothetical protein